MPGPSRRARPTIADIAERAGVSSGAVSYALNDRPGVSDATRARILEVARDMGWTPSAAARQLSGGGSATLGLLIRRDPTIIGVEPFFMTFVAGVESVLAANGYALLLHVSPEPDPDLETYRTWWAARRVDGVFLTDLVVDDPRVDLAIGLGMPAVVVGDPSVAAGLPAVWSDDAKGGVDAVRALAEHGHRVIAHVTGPGEYVHTIVRRTAIQETVDELGLVLRDPVETDYTLDSGAVAVRHLLGTTPRPTGIIFDNDLTALAGVQVADEIGLSVPDDLSVIAWDDSPLCRLVSPPLSALSRDVAAYGAAAATALLATVRGEEVNPGCSSVPELVDRGTIATQAVGV